MRATTPNRQLRTPTGTGIRIFGVEDKHSMAQLLESTAARTPSVERIVATIVSDVRARGDRAVLKYARKFDGLEDSIDISVAEMRKAARGVPGAVRDAIRLASRNIAIVAKKQVPRGWRVNTVPGVTIEQRVTPLDRVGCYVPAGRYPLPSSLLMTAIPARVAGVAEIVVACPRPDV